MRGFKVTLDEKACRTTKDVQEMSKYFMPTNPFTSFNKRILVWLSEYDHNSSLSSEQVYTEDLEFCRQ